MPKHVSIYTEVRHLSSQTFHRVLFTVNMVEGSELNCLTVYEGWYYEITIQVLSKSDNTEN